MSPAVAVRLYWGPSHPEAGGDPAGASKVHPLRLNGVNFVFEF